MEITLFKAIDLLIASHIFEEGYTLLDSNRVLPSLCNTLAQTP
jgi:hypothetical protein